MIIYETKRYRGLRFVLEKLCYETEWMRCELRRICFSPRLYYMMCREDTFCCFVIRVPVKTHMSDSVSMNNTSKLYFFIIIVSVLCMLCQFLV